MGSSTWTCPGGVTFVQVECGGSGAKGNSALPQSWRGQGGGGGGYSRKRVPVVPTTVYNVTWGDGLTVNSEPNTQFGVSTPAFTSANAAAGTNGGAVTPAADVSYAGGNSLTSDFAPAPGRGGGGAAGRNGAGGTGSTPGGGAGGSNAPSTSVGNGGNGGTAPAGAGHPGTSPSGGGGGMGGGGAVGPDLSGNGAPGWVMIYNDTDAHGFDPTRATLAVFGTAPDPPPRTAPPPRSFVV